MKNKLLFLASFFCLSVFAAFQYEIVTEPYTNAHGEGTQGNYFHIHVTSGSGTFYIVDKINNLMSMPGNNEVLAKVAKESTVTTLEYGYVDLATDTLFPGTGNTIITNHYKHGKWQDLVYQTGYEVGTFSAGETFGLWVANLSGTINTSTYGPYSYRGSYNEDSTDAFGTILAQLEYTTSPTAIFFGIAAYEAEAPAVSGQPLPGTLASLALAAGAMGLCRRKRKKN
ncbi:MAG: hypothetical protein GX902_08930 [Lentisphaerae bacterium]|nr:hypothetical protein [Lentisphaerota bacterium]